MKLLRIALLFISCGKIASAYSHGLENIIVEKYYVSDANDAAAGGGKLPVGSVTYRIYVDMLPNYRLQAVYGVPSHELRIATTTSFYNNEDRGASTANQIPKRHLKNGTLMLDSWVSVGAASDGDLGILKHDDNGIETLENTSVPKALQNSDPVSGIPLMLRDGLIAASPLPSVTVFGLDSAISLFFGIQNGESDGQVFSSVNGSWASFGGSVGRDSTNKVLIAQVTTNGSFSFELNIQIGTPGGGVENYVAKNPSGKEIQMAGLIYRAAPPKAGIKTKRFSEK